MGKHVMVFEDVFPKAINVFVHTDFSNKPAMPELNEDDELFTL